VSNSIDLGVLIWTVWQMKWGNLAYSIGSIKKKSKLHTDVCDEGSSPIIMVLLLSL